MVRETFVAHGSSHILAFTYDPEVENLEVEFTDGTTYVYYSVPPQVYRQWCQDGGSGKFFHSKVRGRFAYEQQ